jgi:hypothetical protein
MSIPFSGISEAKRRATAEAIQMHYQELEVAAEQAAIWNERVSSLRAKITALHVELKRMDEALSGITIIGELPARRLR